VTAAQGQQYASIAGEIEPGEIETSAAIVSSAITRGDATEPFRLECPLIVYIVYTDVNRLRLLGRLGEWGSFGGLTTCSCLQEGEEHRAVTKGKFPHSSCEGAYALDFAKYAQEPRLICKT
jgi:hypothetical protein